MKMKFYLCPTCGNLIIMALDSGVTPYCCGEEMVEQKPGSSAVARFSIGDEKPVAAYEYCSIHGLWMTPIDCKTEKVK